MTPNPASGYHIDHWDGTDSPSSNHLTMQASVQTVTAYYVQDTETCYQLLRNFSGNGYAMSASPISSPGAQMAIIMKKINYSDRIPCQ